MDNINLPKYCMHHIVTLRPISHITDFTLFSSTHANNHITPKDD